MIVGSPNSEERLVPTITVQYQRRGGGGIARQRRAAPLADFEDADENSRGGMEEILPMRS